MGRVPVGGDIDLRELGDISLSRQATWRILKWGFLPHQRLYFSAHIFGKGEGAGEGRGDGI